MTDKHKVGHALEEGDFLYATEVREFFAGFDTDREKALAIAFSTWLKDGFVEIENLFGAIYNGLLAKNGDEGLRRDIENDVKGIITTATLKDSLTGFYAKNTSPLIMGLGHFYGKLTGKPVFRVDVDFNNVGGTNDHFRELLQQVGRGNRATDGNTQTDLLIKLAASKLYMSFKRVVDDYNRDGKKPRAYIHPMRPGGDEFSLIVTGVAKDHIQRALADYNKKMDKILKKGQLLTHNNPKDATRPGFCGAAAFVDMTGVEKPADIGLRLDSMIAGVKLEKSVLNMTVKAELAHDAALKQAAEFRRIDIAASQRKELEAMGLATPLISAAQGEQTARLNIELNEARAAYAAPLDALQFVEEQRNDADVLEADLALRPDGKAAFQVSYDENNLLAAETDIARGYMLEKYDNFLDRGNNRTVISRLTGLLEQADPSSRLRLNTSGEDGSRVELTAKRMMRASPDGKAILSHIEFGNLAGINNISHEHGNAVIAHYGTIIKRALNDVGLEGLSHGAFSDGGSRFKIVLPTSFKDKDGAVKSVDEGTMKMLNERIRDYVDREVRDIPVGAYFAARGLEVDPDKVSSKITRAVLTAPKVKMSDLPHPKNFQERGVKVYDGFIASLSGENVGEQIGHLNNEAERKINSSRMGGGDREPTQSQSRFKTVNAGLDQAAQANRMANLKFPLGKGGKDGR